MQNLQIPNHIAVVLDGNRRWAKARGLPAWMGHRYGAQTFDKFVDWCIDLNVPNVSVYALSTENLNRPKKEIKELFEVYYNFLKSWEKKIPVLDKNEVRVRFIGDLNRLPPKLLKLMGKFMTKTAKHQKKFFNILVAYSARLEMTEAIKKVAEKVIKLGKIEVTEKDVEQNLLVPVPVDLVIRTGGMSRLSNLLLWQVAYAELYITDTLWPDFTKKELVKAIRWYNKAQRNFGK